MEHIRICNLRCLADTSVVKIKPITLLVGANSSGKSTFLRAFPLLRQSAETRTVSGLLLNEGYVNFGFFHEAIHHDANPPELRLEFGLTLQRGLYQGGKWNEFLIEPIEASCELTYVRREKEPLYHSLCAIRLTLGSADIQLPSAVWKRYDIMEIIADEEAVITKFRVNEFRSAGEVAQLRLSIQRGLVPILTRALGEKASEVATIGVVEIRPFEKMLLDETDVLFHGRTSKETRLHILRGIRIGNPEKMLLAMKEISWVSSWKDRISNWTIETPKFKKVRNLLLADITSELLASINVYMTESARSVHYFQPVRASVERDYLRRDIPVDSVDPSGVNVAMLLASLEGTALQKFRQWTQKHFGFEVFPQSVSDGARIALRMKEGSSEAEFNLADMGFGFSQMLPFLVQIWALTERPMFHPLPHVPLSDTAFPKSYLIAIEQPELHLHPALQARLADFFVTIARISHEKKIPVNFMLETHSPTIIERIGQLIEDKALTSEDVQVLLFERGQREGRANTATVRSVQFDSEGVLQDWPFGFLSPLPAPRDYSAASDGDAIPS